MNGLKPSRFKKKKKDRQTWVLYSQQTALTRASSKSQLSERIAGSTGILSFILKHCPDPPPTAKGVPQYYTGGPYAHEKSLVFRAVRGWPRRSTGLVFIFADLKVSLKKGRYSYILQNPATGIHFSGGHVIWDPNERPPGTFYPFE